MPIKVTLLDNGLGFNMKASGIVTGDELLAAIDERFSSEERIQRYVYGLSDYTEVTKSQISSDVVKRVATRDKQVAASKPDLVMGITAPEDLLYGLCRMFQAHAEETDWPIGVFRTLGEAHAWVRERLEEIHGPGLPIHFKED